MENLVRLFAFSLFILFTAAVSAAPANVIYDFKTQVDSHGYFPELDFYGSAHGQLVTKFSENTAMFTPESLTINFEQMPKIVVENFMQSHYDSQTYIAHVKNAWIFRSVRVELHSPNFDFYSPVHARIWVDYSESYVGQNNVEGPELVNLNIEPIQRNTFSVIDVYSTTFEDKPVIIKLNKNLSRRFDPENGFFGEGIELQVTWYGHGEGSYYFQYPITEPFAPFAIKSDKEFTPEGEPENIYVEYRDGSMVNMTNMVRLSDVLMQITPPPSPF